MNLLSPTGYGCTGSSAVTNILQEFESILCLDNSEFQFTSYTDGIADLENILIEGHPMKVDLAVKRFLQFSHTLSTYEHYKKCFNNKFEEMTIQYINEIISINWTGSWPHQFIGSDNYSKKRKIKQEYFNEVYNLYLRENNKKIFYEPDGWQPTFYHQEKVYYDYLYNEEKINDFIKKTKIFTDNLLKETVYNKNIYKYILLDQAIPPVNTSHHMRYFSSPKVIIVDRDPRDLFVLNKVNWGVGYIPSYDVQLFIKYYSMTRQLKKKESLNTNNNIFFIPFESLIYKYDDSIKEIIEFMGFTDTEHTNKLKYFNPDLSIKNTQVFVDYPELHNDIKLIEKHLEEYCYKYPYTKEKKEEKHFFIEDINQKFNKLINDQIFEKKITKYLFIFIFKSTMFYRNTHTPNLNKNFLFLIKIIIKLIILPFEMLFFLFTVPFIIKKKYV